MEKLKTGVVGDISAKVENEYPKGYKLTSITDKSKMELTASFNGSQIASMEVGHKAEVSLPDYKQTIEGIVTKVNKTGRALGNGAILFDVDVEINNPGGLTQGTAAKVTVKNNKGSFVAVETSDLIVEWVQGNVRIRCYQRLKR